MDFQIITTRREFQEFLNDAVEASVTRLLPYIDTDKKELNAPPLSVKELCTFLGVTEPTIIRWRKKGKIPFMQVGSRVLFDRVAVLKALEVKKQRG